MPVIFDFKSRQRLWRPRKQFLDLFEMVFVDVIIAERVDEFADLQITNMSNQLRQQCIRADVERDTKKGVRRPLIKLAMKDRGSSPTVREGSSLLNLKLKQRVTWGQVNVVTYARVPAADDQSSRVRVCLNFINQTRNLIH